LPIVILKKWDEWTEDRMKEELERTQQSTFRLDRLTLSYWRKRIGLSSALEDGSTRWEQPFFAHPMTFAKPAISV